MKAISLDLRERVLRGYENRTGTVKEVAQAFDVCESFVYKMAALKDTSGTLAIKPHGGGRVRLLGEKELNLLTSWVYKKPDIQLAELKDRFRRECSLRVSLATLCRALKDLKLSRKKKRGERQKPTRPKGRLLQP